MQPGPGFHTLLEDGPSVQAKGTHRCRLQQQLVALAFDRPSGGQLAPGGGSNRFQCVSIGTGLNHHPVPNEDGDIDTG